jgi:hypothetical protein
VAVTIRRCNYDRSYEAIFPARYPAIWPSRVNRARLHAPSRDPENAQTRLENSGKTCQACHSLSHWRAFSSASIKVISRAFVSFTPTRGEQRASNFDSPIATSYRYLIDFKPGSQSAICYCSRGEPSQPRHRRNKPPQRCLGTTRVPCVPCDPCVCPRCTSRV